METLIFIRAYLELLTGKTLLEMHGCCFECIVEENVLPYLKDRDKPWAWMLLLSKALVKAGVKEGHHKTFRMEQGGFHANGCHIKFGEVMAELEELLALR